MAEFLETIETIRSGEADARRIFGGEGRAMRTGRRQADPAYLARLAEAASFVADLLSGARPVSHLQEAMSTSDFPFLFGDILDRTVLAAYREWPVTWPAIAGRRTVRDFRNVKEFPPVVGGDSRLSPLNELEEYKDDKVDEQAPIQWAVRKHGRRMPFSWESMINDDLDQLKDTPVRFGRAARRTEERAVTDLYVDANGPHASLYTVGNKNIVNILNGAAVNNPPLSIAGLQDAMIVLAAQVDEVGEPIMLETITLVVPPALEITARNILNATQLELTTAGGVGTGGTNEQRLQVTNWMRNRVNLQVNPYIPLTAVTANGSRSWFLFADPNVGRPALRIGFLRGHEEPEIFMKSPNAQRVGGGEADPMLGSFENDAIEYKVRHVLGTARIDFRATCASNGSSA